MADQRYTGVAKDAQPREGGPVWGTWKTHGNAEYLYYYGMDRKAPRHPGFVVRVSAGPNLQMVPVETEKAAFYSSGEHASLSAGFATRFWAEPAFRVGDAWVDSAEYDRRQQVHIKYDAKGCEECGAHLDGRHQHEEWCSETDQPVVTQHTADVRKAARIEGHPTHPRPAQRPARTGGDTLHTPCGLAGCPVCGDTIGSCWCGCGRVVSSGRRFAQGHDARHLSWFVRRALVEYGLSEADAKKAVRRHALALSVWGDQAANSIREGSERYGARSYHMANVPAEHHSFRVEQARMVAGMFPELA